MEKINFDCRHFKGDVPCKPHKELKIHCEGCQYYDKIDFKILIIKLDAPGDVLRTTCILPGLKERYPKAQVTWLTRKESLCFFDHNPYVDRVLEYGPDALVHLQTETYDFVINPDASPISAGLASMAKGKTFKGFYHDSTGGVSPANDVARKWLEMGIFDDIKKANADTYQKIVMDMIGIKPTNYDIIFKLDQTEKAFAASFAKLHGISEENFVVGLNTGAGKRWQNKKWTFDGYLELIDLIRREFKGVKILLYGGPEEIERNRELMERRQGLIDTGCSNSVREFIALLGLCDILVTGDTMALHAALALKKKVVALFGPTSSAEIDLYGRGRKVSARMDCLCCYRPNCDITPSCMDRITPEAVFSALKEMHSAGKI